MEFRTLLGRFERVAGHQDGGYTAVCPAHADSNPSLRIWRGDDLKVRTTCRAGCPTRDVIAAAGLSWGDMFNASGEGKVVSSVRQEMVGTGLVAILAMYVDETSERLAKASDDWALGALEYLHDRFGVTPTDAARLGVGVDTPDSGTEFPFIDARYRQYPRVTVPLRGFDGVARGLQGRDLSGACRARWMSLTNPDGQRWSPYGVMRAVDPAATVLITEGPGDALTAVAAGYTAVAVRGASLVQNVELLGELSAGLAGQRVGVVGDNDEAGQRFAERVATALAGNGVEVVRVEVQAPYKDLTEWREQEGQLFKGQLSAAVSTTRRMVSAPAAEADTGALLPDAGDAERAVRLMTALSDRYGSSDVMNAHALVAFTGGHIKYASGLGYHVWNGVVWEQSETRVRQAVHYMGAALTSAAMATGETEKDGPGDQLRKVSRGFTLTRNIDALLRELRAVPSVHVDASEFDARPDLLTFRNGTVDMRTGALRPHDPADMLTYALDIDYDPDAKCPRWEEFLEEIFPGEPELPGYIQRVCGYGITGNVSEQCFVVLWGKGANGKSVLTDTLTHVFRSISKTTPFATFEEKASGGVPNDIAALRGSRLVMASEGESGRPMSEAILKRVTGKDMIAARFLRKEFFEFKPSFLLMLATNHKPKFRGQDEGLWRRVKMVPFKRWFAPHERDHHLDQKLASEEKGIAAWAVRGAVEWHKRGLQDPDIIRASGTEYRETSDQLAGFYPGVLEPSDDLSTTPGNDAFNLYLEWCAAENLPAREQWTRTTFYSAMEERGITRKKTNKGISLVGCRLADAMGRELGKPAGPGIFG